MQDKSVLDNPSIGNLTLGDLVGVDLILAERRDREVSALVDTAAPRERGYRYAHVSEDIVIETDLIAQDLGPIPSER